MYSLPPNWSIKKPNNSKNNRFYYYDIQRNVSQWLRPFPPPGYEGPWPLYIHCAHILIKHKNVRNPRTHNKQKPQGTVNLTREQALKKIRDLSNEIKKGNRTFETVASKESDCASYSRMGDLRWCATNQLDPAFVARARTLQVDEISDPVESTSGWHIIKRLDGVSGSSQALIFPPEVELEFFVPRKKDSPNADKMFNNIKAKAPELYNLLYLVETQPTVLKYWKDLILLYCSAMLEFTIGHEIYLRGMLYFFPGEYEALSFACQILNRYNNRQLKKEILETALSYTWNPKFWMLWIGEAKHDNIPITDVELRTRMMNNVGFTVNTAQYWLQYISILQDGGFDKNHVLTELKKALDIGLENNGKLIDKLKELEPESVEYYIARQEELRPIVERRKKIISEVLSISDDKAKRLKQDYSNLSGEDDLRQNMLRNFLDLEKTNDAKYSHDLFVQAMDYSYRLAIGVLWWQPSIWLEYWRFLAKEKQEKKAEEILAIGRKAVGDTPLFELRRAQHFINLGEYEKAKEIYTKLLKRPDPLQTSALTLLFKATADLKGEPEAIEIIQQNMQLARPQFFINAAKFCQNSEIAWSIFQMGVDRYPHVNSMIIAAAEFLEQHRDVRNTRLLFQQSLAEKKEQLQFEIKKRLFQFELDHIAPLDHLNETQKVFKSTTVDPSILYMHRFKFMDLYPLDPDELRVWGHLANNGSIDLVENASTDSLYLTNTPPYGCPPDALKRNDKWNDTISTNRRKATTQDNVSGQPGQKRIPREVHHLLKEISEFKIHMAPYNVDIVIQRVNNAEIKDYRQMPQFQAMPPY
ncbi:hypothetical protein TRFO_26094 [Tritrichomonas foetus]|uniref:peptidylprolyl isomerase n=1 Tax=Tritrichomonas foetus TaxID=1144522 RepID=A0A1J4K8G5_9EUKA|nr:hypothetical protein TRFO_26094 [Tritrichomonas foetus]|eukprot:OHT05958.1 hypothetical protein TRFO_26094 [Tritrichomonas foetus]